MDRKEWVYLWRNQAMKINLYTTVNCYSRKIWEKCNPSVINGHQRKSLHLSKVLWIRKKALSEELSQNDRIQVWDVHFHFRYETQTNTNCFIYEQELYIWHFLMFLIYLFGTRAQKVACVILLLLCRNVRSECNIWGRFDI